MKRRENELRASIFINPELTEQNLKKANELRRYKEQFLTQIEDKFIDQLLRKARALPKHH